MSDHNPRDPHEMSVEDENRRNLETDDMHSILDSFLRAKEETLEELVGGFMYLTMEDMQKVSRAATDHSASIFLAQNAGTTSSSATASVLDRLTTAEVSNTKEEGRGTGELGRLTEDIDEEVIENTAHGCEDSLFRHRPASLTKFDNFLLSEDESGGDGDKAGGQEEEDGEKGGQGQQQEEQDWMPTSGYMASFAEGNTPLEEPLPKGMGTTHQKPSDTITVQAPDHSCWQHCTVLTQDTAQTLSTHLADNDSQRARPATSTNCDNYSRVCDAVAISTGIEAPAWALNPGEAQEEVDEVPVMLKMSVIGVSTVNMTSVGEADGNRKDNSGHPEVTCSNEVVPFELEDGYDYDTVVCTPKFTPAEMNYLTSFQPHNT